MHWRKLNTYDILQFPRPKTLHYFINRQKIKKISSRPVRHISWTLSRPILTNDEVRQRTQQSNIIEVIRKRRMKWAGHILRMDERRNPKQIFNYKSEGKQSKGRPRKRWTDCLEEDLSMAGLNLNGKTSGRHRKTLEEIANDRELCRDVMEESMAGHSWRTMTWPILAL